MSSDKVRRISTKKVLNSFRKRTIVDIESEEFQKPFKKRALSPSIPSSKRDNLIKRSTFTHDERELIAKLEKKFDTDGGKKVRDSLIKTLINLEAVSKLHKEEQYSCKYCDYKTITRILYRQHLKTHIHERKRLQCPMCEFTTQSNKYHLLYHLRDHVGCIPCQSLKTVLSCFKNVKVGLYPEFDVSKLKSVITKPNIIQKLTFSLKQILPKPQNSKYNFKVNNSNATIIKETNDPN